jgi:intein-encoded DNA endonuclease-like protein
VLIDNWLGKCPVTRYNIDMPIFKKVNKDFFKKWTPEMAYVLGFFAADGYITVNRRGGQFWCIQITDKKLLKQIKKTIKSEHKISVRLHKRPEEKDLYRLQIGSVKMCNDLRNIGFNERKTKSLAVPNVPSKYFSDFVRGYFDGDGHVWIGYIHKERKTRTLVINTGFTSCSKKFLEALNEKLESLDICGGIIRKGSGNSYRLTYSVKNSLKLCDFMYNKLGQSGLFLERKRNIFWRYIDNASVV